ncbi:hypothetical protein LWI28_019833 [Acer negundo]|uniref:RNase H type-1 domain-containing protein n=1 Tax=Acer negundo TaxID=4023 RepID=A0AAD5I7L3_ACENE|nr:hypothetical protein LWI28_019833 [Acer negundo]
MGAVIRDSNGKIVMAVSKPFPGNFSAEIGEFLALREVLLMAKSHNLQIHIVEVDALEVASTLNSTNPIFSDACFVIKDILALFKEVGVVKCQAIPRSGNSLAHNLASLASSSVKENYWLSSSPDFMFPLCC